MLFVFIALLLLWYYSALTSYLAAGRAFLNTGRYAQAQLKYQQASTLCPRCPAVSWGLEKARLYDPTQPGKFEDRLQPLLETNPDDPHVRIAAGNLAVFQGKTLQAIDHYKKALELDPSVTEAYFRLAIEYQKEGESQKALENYLQAVDKAKPAPPQYLANLASLYIELQDYDKAMEYFQQLDRDFLLGHQEIALLQRLQGKLSEAVDQQHQLAQLLGDSSITALPENQDPWYFETDKERIEFHTLPNKKAYIYYSLSTTLYLLGRDAEAQEYLNKAKELNVPKKESHIPQEEAVKAVVIYDLQRLATEQPRWRQRSEDYWRQFLATTR